MTIDATAEPATGYALDPNWHAERARLDSLTALYDPGSLAVCERLGLSPGWRCLDVGAGTGTLALALAERVAPTGTVVALDIDTRFLEPLAAPRLEPVALDVTEQPLPRGEFDLVHARLLLEHFPARGDVLSNMIGATKTGGWVLVEDFDWATALLVGCERPGSATSARARNRSRSTPTRCSACPSGSSSPTSSLRTCCPRGSSTRTIWASFTLCCATATRSASHRSWSAAGEGSRS